MALHYILDGYNIIHKIPGMNEGSLEEQRHHLIRFIEGKHPQGSRRNQVTIVFDGSVELGGFSQQTIGSVKIRFSYDETADDLIKKMVEKCSVRNMLVVVTDDRAIKYYVRSLGAGTLSVREFCPSEKRQQKVPISKKKKEIPTGAEQKITEELKNIWLKDDS